MKKLVIILFTFVLAMPLIPVYGQGGLTEDEQALLDRMFAALDKEENYTSYYGATTESLSLEMSIMVFGQALPFSQSSTTTTEGYTTRLDDVTNAAGTVEVAFESAAPDENVSYVIEADVIRLDEVLYVNAAYVESEGDVLPIEEGWLVIEDLDAIPQALEELSLDDFFSNDDENTLFDNPELLAENADSVTLEEGELEDGTPIEIITVTVDDNVGAFFAAIADVEEDENPFVGLILGADSDGLVVIQVGLDEEDNAVLAHFTLTIGLSEINLDDLEIEGLPEGATLDLVVDADLNGERSGFGEEYPAIEMPVE